LHKRLGVRPRHKHAGYGGELQTHKLPFTNEIGSWNSCCPLLNEIAKSEQISFRNRFGIAKDQSGWGYVKHMRHEYSGIQRGGIDICCAKCLCRFDACLVDGELGSG